MLPYPKKIRILKKSFWITSRVIYQSEAPLTPEQYKYLASDLDNYYQKMFSGADMDEDNFSMVAFELAPQRKKVPQGWYRLIIRPYMMLIQAETYEGLVYGMQSLKQAWYKVSYNARYDLEIPCLDIEDWPSFPWRGMHLDVSRHFFDYKFVRKYLDWMVALKLNKFHWHLSDDQGWRLESKRFPRLHEVGSKRKELDGSIYGGYYSQKQAKLVLDHARDRGIEVIPEIDLPGHTQAILAAYPDLACFPGEFETLNVWGISQEVLCAGKDSVLEFLKGLLDEVMDVFPGEYIHLGGDEVPKDNWKKCPHCQKRMQDNKLKNEEELQSWFLKQLVRHVQKRGKTVIGWDEILDGNIDKKPVVMCWRGDAVDAARKAHDNGNSYIICPNNKFYFDWHYCKDPETPGSFGITTNQDVYELELNKYKFSNPKLFLGGQANLWTEKVPDAKTARELVNPRMFFLAELFWSDPQEKSFRECFDRFWELAFWI
jgi:hexosaminidase